MKKVAIIGGRRIPFSRSMTKYMGVKNYDLLLAPIKALVDDYNLKGKELGEVATGAVMKHPTEWNLAREVTMGSGLSPKTPAYDLQQACGTSLEAAILIANKIALGQIECGIAGGVDTNSDLPVTFSKGFRKILFSSYTARKKSDKIKPWFSLRPKHFKPQLPTVKEPRTKMSMGESCEVMAKNWNIPQDQQDKLALTSHKNAEAAWADGFYKDIVVPFNGVEKDQNIRANSTLEKMAKLRPAFDKKNGTLTAANSSPLTDGASCVLLGSEEWAKANNLPVLAYLTFGQTAAVDYVNDEGLLMAPAYAVPKLLKQANLTLQDFDFYEIHEAFAAQVLCTLRSWESEDFCKNKLGLDKSLGSIDQSKMNIKGGSIAIGHPFAATGSRIVTSLAKMINEKGSGRGLISICTAGGMGVTAIIEK